MFIYIPRCTCVVVLYGIVLKSDFAILFVLPPLDYQMEMGWSLEINHFVSVMQLAVKGCFPANTFVIYVMYCSWIGNEHKVIAYYTHFRCLCKPDAMKQICDTTNCVCFEYETLLLYDTCGIPWTESKTNGSITYYPQINW